MPPRSPGRPPAKPSPKPTAHPSAKPAPKPAKPIAGRWFAVAAPGLEDLAEAELRALPGPAGVTAVPGGVQFQLPIAQLPALLPMLRLPNRLLLELGTWPVHAYEQIEPCVRRIDWAPMIHPFAKLTVQASASGSRLRFKDILERRVEGALREAIKRPFIPDRTRRPELEQRVHARLLDDQLTLSIDAAGEMLHRRGWRASVGEAPLRENTAAAMIRLSGWDGSMPLADPFCGSGTIPIEAALIAAGRSSFTREDFAASEWPALARAAWRPAPPPSAVAPTIYGSDHDPKALAAAHDNAARADLSLRWQQIDAADADLPGPTGWIITNPPYGQRLGGEERAYRKLGALLRRYPGWKALFLSPDRALAALAHPRAECLRIIPNGGLKIGIFLA